MREQPKIHLKPIPHLCVSATFTFQQRPGISRASEVNRGRGGQEQEAYFNAWVSRYPPIALLSAL
jgi:hypothetical protein